MIKNSLENDANNQKLSIKKRFLITNNLFKKELKKIKSELIKERIKNDCLRYLEIIEYQKIQNNYNRYRNNKEYLSKLLKQFSAEVEISIPKKILIKLFFFQINLFISWMKDKKRNFKINFFILNAVADDLLNHIYKKKRDHNIEIIIPTELIFFANKNLFRKTKLNTSCKKIEPLNFYLDKIYRILESYYLKTELISMKILNFIETISKLKIVNSITCFSNHQSYLENHLSSQYKNISKKWKGVYIALHGGCYGISYGNPIMYYHCLDNLKRSPNYLLPIELHKHFFEDIDTFNKDLSLTLLNKRKILKKQYGFEIIKNFKNSKIKNDHLYIFTNNIVPNADPWSNYYSEFQIKESLERWKKIRDIWTKGKTYIVLRPACKNYLMKFYKKEVNEINLIIMNKSYNLDNSYMIFEGQSSAIREHARKSRFSLIYLPKKIFCLSKNNFIKKDFYYKENKINIVDDEKRMLKNLKLVI